MGNGAFRRPLSLCHARAKILLMRISQMRAPDRRRTGHHGKCHRHRECRNGRPQRSSHQFAASARGKTEHSQATDVKFVASIVVAVSPCETFLTADSRTHSIIAMRDIDYIRTVVELKPALVPRWLEVRLQRWFTEVMHEPLPEEIVRLLRRLEDEH